LERLRASIYGKGAAGGRVGARGWMGKNQPFFPTPCPKYGFRNCLGRSLRYLESIDTVWYKVLVFANMQIKPNKTKHEHVPIDR
jgi:hypothetical protein